MKKIIIAVILLVLIVGTYLLFNNNKQEVDVKSNSSTEVITNTVGSQNPFDLKVNPLDGYKNPFSK